MANLPLEHVRRWISPYESDGNSGACRRVLHSERLSSAVDHAASDLESEVGGILVGNWCIDPELTGNSSSSKPACPARFTRQGSVYLTFTQDSLVDIHAEMDEHYPEKQLSAGTTPTRAWAFSYPHMTPGSITTSSPNPGRWRW